MQLVVFIKGNNKYSVEDTKARTLYNIKKKIFGNNNKLFLLNSSNYHLYTLICSGVDTMSYTIEHNDSSFMRISCKSRFLSPDIECNGKNISYRLVSENRRDFKIMSGEEQKGKIETNVSASGELQYELEIDDQFFDDYIPLFAIVVDKIYGETNRQPHIIEEIIKEKRNKNQ
ncbi:MAG: hypothetical protein K2H28_07415 [Ruminococcus sp.]|nr:hypothetical protein [Ruminococcus sp.]